MDNQESATLPAPGALSPPVTYTRQKLPDFAPPPTPERVLIQATCDNEHFAVVNVTGLGTAPAIRQRILEKLGLSLSIEDVRLFRTEIGESTLPTAPPVDDDLLLALCLQFGDNKGTIKFYVARNQTHQQYTTSSDSIPLTHTLPQGVYDEPGTQWHSVNATRDDPFMTAMFPATSNRQVSQFQLTSPSRNAYSLQPGMTVQELLGSQDMHQQTMPSPSRDEAPPEYAHVLENTLALMTTPSPVHSAGSPASRVSSLPMNHRVSSSSPQSHSSGMQGTSVPSPVPRPLSSCTSEGTAYPLFKSRSETSAISPGSPGDRQMLRRLPDAPYSTDSLPADRPAESLDHLMQQMHVSQSDAAFPSFGSFGDEEIGGTFAQPLDHATIQDSNTLLAETSDTGTVTGTLTTATSNNESDSGSPNPVRRGSEPNSSWAVRPSAEQLYDRIDEYFPRQDLDRPLVDGAGAGEAAAAETATIANEQPSHESQDIDRRALRNVSLPLTRGQNHSIRVIAQNRKRMLDRNERDARRKNVGKHTNTQNTDNQTALDRRRSTKLWGGHTIEMTAESAPPLPTDSGNKPVFKWVKGDLIGKGTYGRVYLALNATTGEMIAVKQVEMPSTESDRESARQRSVINALRSEIETLKDLDHANIVTCLGFEETHEHLSIFLEYVPGGSIGSCLRKHGKFEEDTVSSFLNQTLQGLAYLHNKGILHRDLKADNLLVDYHGTCKISDFGTVRRSTDIYNNVENMSLQGSIFWMAPEVMSLSRKGYSAKVDIWSLGCVVLEMLAGRRPWSDEEAVQAMFKIGAERRAPPVPSDCRLSKPAAHFLRNCFEIDPDRRPTAARLLEHVFAWPTPDWCFEQSALWRMLAK